MKTFVLLAALTAEEDVTEPIPTTFDHSPVPRTNVPNDTNLLVVVIKLVVRITV